MSIPEYEDCESHARLRVEGGVPVGKEPLDLEDLVPHLVDEDWQELSSRLPIDLEESARKEGAILRRRHLRRAEDLLRLALLYALCDWSLRIVAAWACLKGWADLSDTALTRRLQGARRWLGMLLASCVVRTRAELADKSVRVRLVDATVISHPGSKGTDWRVHASVDLGRGCFDGLELTDSKGAETLVRHPASPADILLADAGYGQGRGLGEVLARGTKLVVRIAIGNVRLLDEEGRKLDSLDWLRGVPIDQPAQREVGIIAPEGTFRVRLVARRLSEQAAERARRRLRRRAQRNGLTPQARSLEAAGFIILISNLEMDSWNADQLLALYRLRWQVEMAFKRLKGVLALDGLRTKDPDLAQVYLLAKLFGAVLADRMSQAGSAVGLEWFESTQRPVSPWRWLVLWSDAVRRAVQGRLPWKSLLSCLPRLRRYLCDAPRRRSQQYALARHLVRSLASTAGSMDLTDINMRPLLLP